MNPKTLFRLKIAAVVLIGICVFILLSVNKISSSIVLTASAILIMRPIGDSKRQKWGRIALLSILFAMVLWNISTTDYRDCYATEWKFFDQLLHLFDGFLKNIFGIRPCRGG